jgi:hypothetical protein
MQVENIPEGLDSISVADAVLDLRLTSTLGINVPLELELSAYKEGVLEEVLNKSCVVPAGSKYNPQTTHVIFEDVEDIINVIPDELEIRGSYSVGGFISLNEENFNGAYIEGSYLLYSPFSVQVGQTFFEPEITTIDNGFENRLISADLTLRIESHMPLSGSAYIIACYDSTEFDNPNSTEVDTFFQVLLPTAELGPGGYVTAPGYLEEVQTLNTEQLDMFANASADNPLFIKTSVVINSTGGSAVNCGPNDYIKVGASGHFLVDVDLEEGGGL